MNKSTIIYALVGAILLVSTRQQRQSLHYTNPMKAEQVFAPTHSGFLVSGNTQAVMGPQMGLATGKACYHSGCFIVELADTGPKRQIGLMNRTELDPDKGMLFHFPRPGSYGFWMKNTLIPLDMLWLDGSGVVVEIETATPCGVTGSLANDCPRYGGSKVASYVLEIGAEVAKEKGIAKGSVLEIQ